MINIKIGKFTNVIKVNATPEHLQKIPDILQSLEPNQAQLQSNQKTLPQPRRLLPTASLIWGQCPKCKKFETYYSQDYNCFFCYHCKEFF
jgi:hypothetical protein